MDEALNMYINAQLESLESQINDLTSNISNLAISAISKLNVFNYSIYEKDSQYKAEYDKPIELITTSVDVIKAHIENNLLKLDKFLLENKLINDKNPIDKFLLGKSEYVYKIEKVCTAICKYYNALGSFKEVYNVKLRRYQNELKKATGSDVKTLNSLVALYKYYAEAVKTAEKEYVAVGRKLYKKYEFISKLKIFG